MDRISGLSDELLVKILSFAPTKVVISTIILSKRWETLWLWVPKLDFERNDRIKDFINKNMPLLKAQVIERFRLQCSSSFQPEDIKNWVGIAVSRCVRELDISYYDPSFNGKPVVLLPNSLYTCKSLVTLKLRGYNIIVDVPRTVDLPCLKTLELREVTYSNEDSLRLLLSYCPILEDLVIERITDDNLNVIVIRVKSLLRLSLPINGAYSCDEYVIVTPSLKYFKLMGLYREDFSYLKMLMPKLEEADIIVDEDVETLFESITSVKRLTLSLSYDHDDEFVYHNGIVFNELEYLELYVNHNYWSKLLVRLLEDSPKLRVLKISFDSYQQSKEEYESLSWYNDQSFVPKCLLESLETFEFGGYTGRQEHRDVVSYVFKNAPRLKSSSVKHSFLDF